MKAEIDYLKREERLAAQLTALYKRRGYREYRMRSFEEYSLYLDNKDFLISKNVITFGGMDGKLLALRPDVTLSVIKNVRAARGCTEKLFYNEKVYRVSPESRDYKEIGQIGVEIIGDADAETEAEITLLILKTLEAVGENYLLDVSHMGFVSGLIDEFGGTEEDRAAVFACLREKNTHDFARLADKLGLSAAQRDAFRRTAEMSGGWKDALAEAERIALNDRMRAAARDLRALFSVMEELGAAERMNVNFSIANNSDYYNGVIFNGYIEGVPHAVLTGGRYDKLLGKFGRDAEAIGFALYLGELERYFSDPAEETDVLLLYGDGDAAAALAESERLIGKGLSVRLARSVPAGLRYGRAVRLGEEKA